MPSTIFTVTLDTDGGGFNGYTVVQRLTPTALTLPTDDIEQIRVTFRAGNGEALTITNAYIGHRAGAGDAYDFSTTPVQLLFSGGASGAVSIGSTLTSDWASFAYNKTSDLLIAYYVGGGVGVDTLRRKAGVANTNSYYKVANEAATVDKSSGYTDNGTEVLTIASIEVEKGSGVTIFYF